MAYLSVPSPGKSILDIFWKNPPAPACQGHPAVKIESCLLSLVTSFLSDGLQVCFPVRCTVQLSAVCCLVVCILPINRAQIPG